MQIVEIFSTDQQLSAACPAPPAPPAPRLTRQAIEPANHLSCCCDWFCLMELERGNNFIELDFNVRQKARYFLISFSLQLPPALPLSISLAAHCALHNSLVIKRDTCFKHVPDSGSLRMELDTLLFKTRPKTFPRAGVGAQSGERGTGHRVGGELLYKATANV